MTETRDDRYADMYNAEAEKYDQRSFESAQGDFSARYKNELVVEALNRFGSHNPERVILDCPSGTGRIVHHLVKQDEPFGHIYAFDISPGMLKVNADNLPAQADKVTFKTGNMKALEFDDNGIDEAVIASFAYLVPRDEYEDYVKDIYRVLKPDGIAVIEVSNALCAYSPISLVKVLWHRLAKKKPVKSYAFSWELKNLFGDFKMVKYWGTEYPLVIKSYGFYKGESKFFGKTPFLKMFSGKFTVILKKPS